MVYRAAIRALREIKENPDATVEDNIAAWRTGTRKKLAKQRALPVGLADAIADEVDFVSTKLVSNADGGDGGTSKLLIETHDGHQVEAVVIRRHGRATTICVSSQVGCQMGCQFCATGTMGILGDLTAAEILEQVAFSKLAPSKLRQVPLKNIVFMGMGEPLNNFEHVKAAVLGLTDSNRFGMGRGHVTVSTVGVVPYIKRLTSELSGVPLALSLHAPNQVLRERIVPVASKAWPLPTLIAALDAHIEAAQAEDKAGGRKFTGVMVEYVLLAGKAPQHCVRKHRVACRLHLYLQETVSCSLNCSFCTPVNAGVNDSLEHAVELADLLQGRPLLINLIPYNANVTAEIHGFKGPTEEAGRAFGRYGRAQQFHWSRLFQPFFWCDSKTDGFSSRDLWQCASGARPLRPVAH
jgi:adenine C2-methylase RlmN of 23S rRNA A2503 and tRNA A37